MQIEKRNFISLEAISAELCLPKSYLKDLAIRKLIPSLDVNGRLRFDIVAVIDALSKLASAKNGGQVDGC